MRGALKALYRRLCWRCAFGLACSQVLRSRLPEPCVGPCARTCEQVHLLPHAPAPSTASSAPESYAGGSMVLLERWVLAHERAASDGSCPASPTRRPSLFESARSLEVPVIYKRTVRDLDHKPCGRTH